MLDSNSHNLWIEIKVGKRMEKERKKWFYCFARYSAWKKPSGEFAL